MSQAQPQFDPTIVRAVAFDGFGTVFLYPASRFKEAFGRIAARLSPPVDGDALWESWLDVGRRKLGQAGPEEGPQRPRSEPFRPYSEIWPEQFAQTFEAVGASGDPEAETAFLFAEMVGAGIYPEAPSVLDALRRRYPLALVSNADEAFLRPPLEASGLRFDTVISSEAAQAYKPEPEIFQFAARSLGLTPREILYVGDSPRADVPGAIGAGLQMAWVNRDGVELPEGVPLPHLTISGLEPLLSALPLGLPD